MEKLKYTVEDKKIAELLGVSNFSTKESAILELVKNAYDANANFIKIKFYDDPQRGLCLSLTDDGHGMNEQIIKQKWMHVGKSDKGYFVEENTKRVAAGSMGIGRFALARLGEQVEIESKAKHDIGVRWETDWEVSNFSTSSSILSQGTLLSVYGLRDNWDRVEVEKLSNFLSRVYKYTGFSIDLFYKDISFNLVNYFSDAQLGLNYTNKINLKFDSTKQKVKISVVSDEFLSEVQKIVGNEISIKGFEKEVDVESTFNRTILRKYKKNGIDINKYTSEIGSFTACLFFSLDMTSRVDKERFFYKRSTLKKRLDTGVILYRNAFSISSYDGSKDWLKLTERVTGSPAAASHPSGKWRVRPIQISGYVAIDRKENEVLRDLSNRQGLDENTHFNLFIDLINGGISLFEEHRQSIIRILKKFDDQKRNQEEKEESKAFKEIVNDPKKITEISDANKIELIKEFKDYYKKTRAYKEISIETEEKYVYDIRILNVLATTGLKASSIAHELDNKRNNISSYYTDIVNALSEYGVWEELNSKEKTRHQYKNVPKLLNNNRIVNEKIMTFVDTILSEIEPQFFDIVSINLKKFLQSIVDKWKNDYSIIGDIKLEWDVSNNEVILPKDTINVIFDNLILNSIQQNEENISNLAIVIKCEIDNRNISFSYTDNGKGLPTKYKNNPFKILDVHQTSRKNGHGLGMWIVNNSIISLNGEITSIEGTSGFKISFFVKEQEEKIKND